MANFLNPLNPTNFGMNVLTPWLVAVVSGTWLGNGVGFGTFPVTPVGQFDGPT